jgi:hypothetical protein
MDRLRIDPGAALHYSSQPVGFRRIEVSETDPYLRDDCPYCGGDATRQYIDHDIYGGKHFAYVVSPCEKCGWWHALKFWETRGNVIEAAALCEPIVRNFILSSEDLNVCDALQTLAADPGRLDELTSAAFERLVAEYLRSQRLAVTNVARVRSSGGDLIAIDHAGKRFLVEAKRWRDHVGIGVIWKLIGAMWENDFEVGMVVTSGSFSRDAQESKAVKTEKVSLRDFHDLAAWLDIDRPRQGSVMESCRQYMLADALSEL